MLLPKACPQCQQGDLKVEQAVALCQRCGYTADANAARRLMTLRALDAARQREQGAAAR